MSMMQKKNAPTGAATSVRADDGLMVRLTINSCNDFTTKANKKQGLIEGILPVGEANAIRSANLADLAGFADVRALQLQIARERASGAIILSTGRNGGGYFRPSPGDAGRAEIARYIVTVKARAANTFAALESARRALGEVPGQTELKGDE